MDITFTQRCTHEQLALDREWIALEAEHSLSINFSNLIHRFLPNARGVFAALAQKFSASEEGIVLTRDQRAFMKVVEAHKYLDLSPIVAYVPEGLDVPYLHYTNALGPAVDHAANVQTLLAGYSTYIAMLLTNHDERFSTKDSAVSYKGLETLRDRFNKDLGDCFKNGSHNTDVRYGDVVERNSDWNLVFPAAASLSDKMNGVDRKVLTKTLNDTVHLMDRLIENIQKDEFKGASPTMLTELADGAYQMASEVEFFATVYYRIMALTASIDRTTKNILKLRG
jgi:hypothetical protein